MRLVPLEEILSRKELELVEAIHARPGYAVLEAEEKFAARPLDLGIIELIRHRSHNYICTDKVTL